MDIIVRNNRSSRGRPSRWPYLSDSCGVRAAEREAAAEKCRALGVPTRFAPDGRAVITSYKHKERLEKAMERARRG